MIKPEEIKSNKKSMYQISALQPLIKRLEDARSRGDKEEENVILAELNEQKRRYGL